MPLSEQESVLSSVHTGQETKRRNKELGCCCLLQLCETKGRGQDMERVTVKQRTQPKIQLLAESPSFRFVRNCLGERNIFTLDVKQEGWREVWRGAQE